MNRRSETRLPITLNALVHPRQGRSWMCQVRDFCSSGMLLASEEGARSLFATGADPQRNDPVNIHFSVPVNGGVRHFRLEARIARVLDNGVGIGVRLIKPLGDDAIAALKDHAGHPQVMEEAAESADPAALRDPRISASDAEAVCKDLEKLVAAALPKLTKAFFDRADQDLLIKARDATSNALQTTYFDAMNVLEKKRGKVDDAFVEDVVTQIREVVDLDVALERRRKNEPAADNPDQLTLVDTDEFEDWLAVAEIISKAEARFAQQLGEIRQRMGLLAKPWSHKDVMPIGPGVVTRALDEALDLAVMPKEVKRDVYKSLQTAAMPAFRSLYTATVKLFEESGIFPPLEHPETLKNARDEADAVHPTPGATPPGPAQLEGAPQAAAPAAGAADPFAGPAIDPFAAPGTVPLAPAAAMPGSAVPGAAAVDPLAAVSVPSAAPGGFPGSHYLPGAAHSVYDAARRLLDLTRHARQAVGAPLEPGVAPPDAAPHQVFQPDEVLSALSELQARLSEQGPPAGPIKPRVLDVLRARDGSDQRAIPTVHSDAMDVVQNLVSSIEQDRLLADGAKDWVRRLQVTLQKLAVKDPDFLDPTAETPHPAIEVLNQLARLGNLAEEGDGIDRDVSQRVEALMDAAVQQFDDDPEVLARLAEDLAPLVDRQTRAYRGNFERTVRASEGQQKLGRARRAVVRAVEERLANRAVPQVVLEMLNPAWRNLMVHTHLRHGEDSEAWHERLELIDKLQRALSEGVESEDEAEALIGEIDRGLDNISFEPGQRVPLLTALRRALTEGHVGERITLTKEQAAAALGLEGVLPVTDPKPEVDDEAQRREWNGWLDKAKKLRTGDWLAVADESGRPRITTLAFIGEEHSSFVLVNRKGIKIKELTLKELTDGLFEGQISILDEADMPLTERASHRMLQNMHNQLAYQASHDELTGLINRKEFDRRLEAAIVSARNGEQRHVLLYIDLDQFKIINSTSGHAAGDALLKELAGQLKHELRGVRAVLARLGGDEFGALIEQVDLEEGERIAKAQLEAIRAIRFDWEERHYSVSASIGIVPLDDAAEDVTTVMRNADAACYAAKEAGRNRAQVYEASDTRLAIRQGVMEWVTQIDRALDEDRLLLNCQRIAPISDSETAEPHYEILLQMVDEEGHPLPPSDFIFAAETYNRMAAIDRWVIRNTFNWMSTHRRELDSIGGLSINVSGHSLNDESFSDFVLKQLSTTKVPTGKVIFEVTETAAIANIDNAIDFMNKMKIIGCQFSLDDFGTGLSSYSYLRNLPVDYVKIDGVFVKDLANNPGDYAVVKSINEIGHFMGKRTIAEFVENTDILDNLREIGVDYAQGYGIERPRRLEEFAKL